MTETPAKRSRAGHGDDSIYWDKSKNRYIGAVSLGYTPSGSRKRPKVSGRTKAEVRQKLRELRKELARGARAPASYTVAQAVNDWLAQGLKGKEASSIGTYRSLADNHVIPYLGVAKLKDLEADDVDEWLEGRAEVLATRSLRMVRSILRRSIAHAQRRGRAVQNVADLVELPEGQPGRPSKSLSLEQGEAALRAMDGTWIHAYVVLSLLVGVRPEEARALTWTHVHFVEPGEGKPHVDVWRSVRRHGDTKTRRSRRSLAMPRQVALVMKAHKSRQQDDFRTAGKEWTEGGLVFPTATGNRRDATDVRRNFRELLRAAGFKNPGEWTTRELRTSFVSLLSDHGIPIEVIARLVGHSGSVTTERVYRKQLRPVISDGAEAMDDIFGDDATEDEETEDEEETSERD